MFGKLKAEIAAHWRRRYAELMGQTSSLEAGPPEVAFSEPQDEQLTPPDAARVARRAACLAAVALRGLATDWPHDKEAAMCDRLRHWLEHEGRPAGIEDELEPLERDAIFSPAGELVGQPAINAVWRWEGAAVLATSLGRLELPPYDQTCDPHVVGDACGVLKRGLTERCRDARFAPGFDAERYACHVLAVHWRLRGYRLRPRSMDFAAFAAGIQWATFNLEGVRLLDGDLAIGDTPISRTSDDDYSLAASITQERHIAANWLIGWNPVYSEVDTPT